MKLFPQHLRDRQHADIIRRRTYGVRGKGDPQGFSLNTTPLPEPKMGFLGRLWTKGSPLSEKQAATGLSAASMSTLGVAWFGPTFVGSLSLLLSGIVLLKHGNAEPFVISSALTAAVSYLSVVPWAKAAFNWCYKDPLGEGEIEYLLDNEATSSDLEKSFLYLVRDAVRQTAEVSPETATEVQAAIVSLGEAIDRLPAVTMQPLDTQAIRQEAKQLQEEALTQTDRVIGESLERRADALLRRASANDQSAVAVRRAAALRAEIDAQIAALREGIATLGTGYGTADSATSANLQHLSESARRLAAEAISTASARAELDSSPQSRQTSYTPTIKTDIPVQLTAGRKQ